MSSKDLQEVLLNRTLVQYVDYFNTISAATVTAVTLRNVNGTLAITSVELADDDGKTFYNVLPKYIENLDIKKATAHCE